MNQTGTQTDRLEKVLLGIRSLIALSAGSVAGLLGMVILMMFVDDRIEPESLGELMSITALMLPVLIGGLTTGSLSPRRPAIHGLVFGLIVMLPFAPGWGDTSSWWDLVQMGYLTGWMLSALVGGILLSAALGAWLGGRLRRQLLRRKLARLQQ